jgi:hypothetical protein
MQPRLALPPPYLSETAPEPGRFTSVADCPRRSCNSLWPPKGYEPAGGALMGTFC